MPRLDRLPSEVLLLIAENFANEQDISAVVQTNQILYHRLHGFLCEYNVKHHQGGALLWAARNGHTHLANQLLNAGASIAAFEPLATPEEDGPTDPPGEDEATESALETSNPLIVAAQGGHRDTLKAMLSETRPNQACSPDQLRAVLHWALRSHSYQLVELLLEYNPPLDPVKDREPSTYWGNGNPSAISVAVVSHFHAVIPLLVKHGAQPGPTEIPGPVERAILSDQFQTAQLLVDHGIPQISDRGLCYAAEKNNKALLQFLADHGTPIEFWGHMPLFKAIMHGHDELVEFLITHGADPNLTCELYSLRLDGFTHLSTIGFAVLFEHLDILKLLLAKGVRPDLDDLRLAEKRGYGEAVAILSQCSYDEVDNKYGVWTHTMIYVHQRTEQYPEVNNLTIGDWIFDPTPSEAAKKSFPADLSL